MEPPTLFGGGFSFVRIETYEIYPNIGEVTFVIISCDVCNNHWDAVVHMETFDSDTQVSALTTFHIIIQLDDQVILEASGLGHLGPAHLNNHGSAGSKGLTR